MKKTDYTPNETEKDIRQFLDIQDNLEQYSDEELEELFIDKGLQDAYDSAALLKQAFISEDSNASKDQENEPHDGINLDAEWESFKQKNYPTVRPLHQWRKIAAAIIAAIMVSGASFAIILWQQHHAEKQRTEQTESIQAKSIANNPITQKGAQTTKKDSTLAEPTAPMLFDNVELKDILTEMGKHYGKKVIFQTNTEHLRLRFEWNKQLPLQQNIQILNGFEHINIVLEDNKIIVK